MRVLLDTCVWGGVKRALSSAGHDVVWTGDWEEDPGDEDILHYAHLEGRILVTIDKDFGELAILHGHPHSGILRLVGFSGRGQVTACLLALQNYSVLLSEGAIVTAEPGRFRIRPPEPNIN